MTYKSDQKELITDRVKEFNCGQRFKELAVRHRKDSPTYWYKALGLKERTQIYHRWKSEHIDAQELLIICADLGITVGEFFHLPNNSSLVTEPGLIYKKGYIEDDIADLKRRMEMIEKQMQSIQKTVSANAEKSK